MANIKSRPFILSIAGSDPSGGAGLQADIKVGQALSVYVLTSVTAITVQNTYGVSQVVALPNELVLAQLENLFNSFQPSVIKIGLLANTDQLQSILSCFNAVKIPIILDPIFAPTYGSAFFSKEKIIVFRQSLSGVELLMPNIKEAMLLANSNCRPKTDRECIQLARQLLLLGVKHVYLKGGHLQGRWCNDYYVTAAQNHVLKMPRLNMSNRHGTGCALSTAVAAYLAYTPNDMLKACHLAKHYQQTLLQASKLNSLGEQYGLLDHAATI